MNELPFVYISTFFLSLASRSHLRQEPTVALRHSEEIGRSLLERGSLGSPFMQTVHVGGLVPMMPNVCGPTFFHAHCMPCFQSGKSWH